MRKSRLAPIKSRPTFAVVADGYCEVWYLQMLKRNERSITVNIEPKIPQKKKLLDQFEIVRELSKDYTKVFWIIDFDVILSETKTTKKGSETTLNSFLRYRKIIETDHENVVIIVNNPCIEFWLLLHFEATSKYFDSCEAAEKQLKKYLKNYEKTKDFYTKQDNDIYLQLKSKMNTAISNAKKLKQFNFKEPHMGYTEMHLFFETNEFGKLYKI